MLCAVSVHYSYGNRLTTLSASTPLKPPIITPKYFIDFIFSPDTMMGFTPGSSDQPPHKVGDGVRF